MPGENPCRVKQVARDKPRGDIANPLVVTEELIHGVDPQQQEDDAPDGEGEANGGEKSVVFVRHLIRGNPIERKSG